jgi:hypothetical protein
MSNVIGFFPVKHLGVDSAEPGPFCIYTIAATLAIAFVECLQSLGGHTAGIGRPSLT